MIKPRRHVISITKKAHQELRDLSRASGLSQETIVEMALIEWKPDSSTRQILETIKKGREVKP